MKNITDYLDVVPYIAILRGITAEQLLPCCELLVKHGYKCIEIPLNTPNALSLIEVLASEMGSDILIGAGTVLSAQDAVEVGNAGGEIIVTPNTNPSVILKARELDLISLVGCFTATEAFTAIEAGATGLKIFPASSVGPSYIKNVMSVLPHSIPVFPVGGISPKDIRSYLDIGISGFGLGGALFSKEQSMGDFEKNVIAFSNEVKR